MMKLIAVVAATVWLAACSAGAAEPSDAQIKQMLIDESIKAYKGACPCPYSVSQGKKCAEQSAYRTPGGDRPKCYASDISAKAVADKKAALGKKAR